MSLCETKSNIDHRFIGCHGLYKNEELEAQIKEAVEVENYEWAHECKTEIERRIKTGFNEFKECYEPRGDAPMCRTSSSRYNQKL